MSVDLTTNPIDFQVSINTISMSDFIATLKISTNNSYQLLYYMYILVEPIYQNIYLFSYSINTAGNFSAGSSKNGTYPQVINQTINNYASCVIAAYPTSFSI
jgi:hypothetical protein